VLFVRGGGGETTSQRGKKRRGQFVKGKEEVDLGAVQIFSGTDGKGGKVFIRLFKKENSTGGEGGRIRKKGGGGKCPSPRGGMKKRSQGGTLDELCQRAKKRSFRKERGNIQEKKKGGKHNGGGVFFFLKEGKRKGGTVAKKRRGKRPPESDTKLPPRAGTGKTSYLSHKGEGRELGH